MIHRIDETIEMKDLPTWLQELWEQNPSLARRAEKHYLELTEQCNIADVSNNEVALDLRELEQRLDDALDKENSETLKKWIESQRQ